VWVLFSDGAIFVAQFFFSFFFLLFFFFCFFLFFSLELVLFWFTLPALTSICFLSVTPIPRGRRGVWLSKFFSFTGSPLFLLHAAFFQVKRPVVTLRRLLMFYPFWVWPFRSFLFRFAPIRFIVRVLRPCHRSRLSVLAANPLGRRFFCLNGSPLSHYARLFHVLEPTFPLCRPVCPCASRLHFFFATSSKVPFITLSSFPYCFLWTRGFSFIGDIHPNGLLHRQLQLSRLAIASSLVGVLSLGLEVFRQFLPFFLFTLFFEISPRRRSPGQTWRSFPGPPFFWTTAHFVQQFPYAGCLFLTRARSPGRFFWGPPVLNGVLWFFWLLCEVFFFSTSPIHIHCPNLPLFITPFCFPEQAIELRLPPLFQPMPFVFFFSRDGGLRPPSLSSMP